MMKDYTLHITDKLLRCFNDFIFNWQKIQTNKQKMHNNVNYISKFIKIPTHKTFFKNEKILARLKFIHKHVFDFWDHNKIAQYYDKQIGTCTLQKEMHHLNKNLLPLQQNEQYTHIAKL